MCSNCESYITCKYTAGRFQCQCHTYFARVHRIRATSPWPHSVIQSSSFTLFFSLSCFVLGYCIMLSATLRRCVARTFTAAARSTAAGAAPATLTGRSTAVLAAVAPRGVTQPSFVVATRSYHENIVDHYENPRNVGTSLHCFCVFLWLFVCESHTCFFVSCLLSAWRGCTSALCLHSSAPPPPSFLRTHASLDQVLWTSQQRM